MYHYRSYKHVVIFAILHVVLLQCQYEDATVACGGKLYPVHRLVLSACSDYFQQMFALTHGKHSVIVLKDITTEVFEALLSYMYIGKVDVRREKISELINAAACLEIRGLAVSEGHEELLSQSSTINNGSKRTIEQINGSVLEGNLYKTAKIPKLCNSTAAMLTELHAESSNNFNNDSMSNKELEDSSCDEDIQVCGEHENSLDLLSTCNISQIDVVNYLKQVLYYALYFLHKYCLKFKLFDTE